tara:strand:- start:462 stop:725 length:264 start_codon:yes stop_codon:yes gene_type:complete
LEIGGFMKLLDWLKSLFVSKAIQSKTEDAVEEVKSMVTEGVEEAKHKLDSNITKLKEKAKTRARDRLGRFIPDDPNTPENEAYKNKD